MLDGKSDEELMTEYKLGNENSFSILYERHSHKIFGYLCAKTSNDALARDIFQATFLKLHRSRDRYRSDLPFLPWLFTICRSELIDAMRKKSKNLEDASEWLPEAPVEEAKEAENVISLNSLPLQQKQALEMRYQDELPFEKIAEKLGTSSSNARQLVSRGIKSLRGIYGKK